MALLPNMKCKSIQLSDRSDYLPNLSARKHIKGNETRIVTTSFYHNCAFCWDKPYKKLLAKTDEQPSLTITDINLPANAKSFNTGSSIEKWSNKRPRLKSSYFKRIQPSEPCIRIISYDNSGFDDLDSEDSDKNSPSFEEICEDDGLIKIDEEEEEIDLDIQKLILESQNYEEELANEEIKHTFKRKHKKNSKHKSADEKKKKSNHKLRKTKTISFSLSKPPSPETVQVIRVDVTSNYSFVDVENGSSCKSDLDDEFCEFHGNGRTINLSHEINETQVGDTFEEQVDEGKFGVSCQKLVLTSRE